MYFVKEYEVEPNKLLAMTFEPRLEQTLVSRVKRSQFDIGMVMDPTLTEGIIGEIEPKIQEMSDKRPFTCHRDDFRVEAGLQAFHGTILPPARCSCLSGIAERNPNRAIRCHRSPRQSFPDEIVNAMEGRQQTSQSPEEGVAVAA